MLLRQMKGQGLDYKYMLKTYYTWRERREEKRRDKLALAITIILLFIAWCAIIYLGFSRLAQ